MSHEFGECDTNRGDLLITFKNGVVPIREIVLGTVIYDPSVSIIYAYRHIQGFTQDWEGDMKIDIGNYSVYPEDVEICLSRDKFETRD